MKKTLMIASAAVFMMSNIAVTEAIAGPENKCKVCHHFNAKHSVGPGLAGIVGREAGKSGFKKHKPALAKGGWVWTEANLRKWICNSKDAIKELSGDDHARTKMPPQKMCGAKADPIIAFLKTI